MIIDHNPIRATLRQELTAIRWFFASQCSHSYLLSQENQRITRQLLPRNAARMGL